MASIPRCARPSIRGFSLVELSIVVAILSIVATLGLEAAATFINRSSTALSRDRLKVVDEAMVQFFRIYGRLPCPAPRDYTAMHLTAALYDYGLENCSNSIAVNNSVATAPGNGLYIGGVPFRTLNLPMMYSLDGFNSKLNYVVTANLTSSGGGTGAGNYFRFGSYGGANANWNGTAGIEVRTGKLAQPCSGSCQILANPSTGTGAAYFLFSSGADQRGAVSSAGTAENACTTAAAGTETRPDTQNCVFGESLSIVRSRMNPSTIPYNVFYDNRYNAGLNLASYFDDVAIWRTKGQL